MSKAKKVFTKELHVLVTPQQINYLRNQAFKSGVSLGQVVRDLVDGLIHTDFNDEKF